MPLQQRPAVQAGGLRKSSRPGHGHPAPRRTSMAARRSHLAAAFQFVHQVDHRPLAQGAQRLLVGGWEVDEPGYQGGEGTALHRRRGPILAGWVLRAPRAESLPKSWHPVPVAIRSREPHGGDRAELAAGYVMGAEIIADGQSRAAEQELLAVERHAALREAFEALAPSGQRLIALLLEDPPVRMPRSAPGWVSQSAASGPPAAAAWTSCAVTRPSRP